MRSTLYHFHYWPYRVGWLVILFCVNTATARWLSALGSSRVRCNHYTVRLACRQPGYEHHRWTRERRTRSHECYAICKNQGARARFSVRATMQQFVQRKRYGRRQESDRQDCCSLASSKKNTQIHQAKLLSRHLSSASVNFSLVPISSHHLI